MKVASPSEWVPAVQDLVANSTRVGGGRMRANFIASKRSWAAKWTNLTQTQAQAILSQIEGRFEFPIKCFDPETGTEVTKIFYKGDRQWEKLQHIATETYHTISVTFIEC